MPGEGLEPPRSCEQRLLRSRPLPIGLPGRTSDRTFPAQVRRREVPMSTPRTWGARPAYSWIPWIPRPIAGTSRGRSACSSSPRGPWAAVAAAAPRRRPDRLPLVGDLRAGPAAGHLDAPGRARLRADLGPQGDRHPGHAAGRGRLRVLGLADDRLHLLLPLGHALRGLLRPAPGGVSDRARRPRPRRLAGGPRRRALRHQPAGHVAAAGGHHRRGLLDRPPAHPRARPLRPRAPASPRASAPRPRRGAPPPSASAPTARRRWRAWRAWRCAPPTARCCSTRPCAC